MNKNFHNNVTPAKPPLKFDLLHQYFETCAHDDLDATAIVCGDLTLTYDELEKASNRLASFIYSQITTEQRLCAIYLERSELPIIAMLAVLKAGLAYIPIDPHYSRNRVVDILNDSEVGLLISQQSLWSNIESAYHKQAIVRIHQLLEQVGRYG